MFRLFPVLTTVCTYLFTPFLPAPHTLSADANSNRKMLLRILRAKNYVCEEAENGRVAVEKYAAAVERGEPFDVILSDYEMPVMNGPDSVREMRRMGCKCFIAGITGNVLQDDIDHFKERGADNVLAKVRGVSCIDYRGIKCGVYGLHLHLLLFNFLLPLFPFPLLYTSLLLCGSHST
jgi:CheY-like chemotaxis protein